MEYQRLMTFSGKSVENGRISDFNIQKESTLHVMFRFPSQVTLNIVIWIRMVSIRRSDKKFLLDVNTGNSVNDVKKAIYAKEGVPPENQRLLFHGQQLEDEKQLLYYQIQNSAILFLAVRVPQPMIQGFSASDKSNPLVKYLMLAEKERVKAVVPLKALQQMAQKEGALPFQTFHFTTEDVLGHEMRMLLVSFLDCMWKEKASRGQVDLLLSIGKTEFLKLLGGNASAEKTLAGLHSTFRQIPGATSSPQYALRMTQGPSKACINFHCDAESYATGTAQIALNDPSKYKGGRLCFFVNNHLHVLERPVGSTCLHQPKVLHGVSAITEGSVKSLFLVDRSSVYGDGSVPVTPNDVQTFLEAREEVQAKRRKVQMCSMCLAKPSEHAVLPCGHLCLCGDCSKDVIQKCPLCSKKVESHMKIIL